MQGKAYISNKKGNDFSQNYLANGILLLKKI